MLLKDYEKAFSYIIPDRDWHINSRGEIEDKIADSHDIVINNKDNIIPMIKNIKIDDSVLESYNLFRKEEKQIVDYLSKRIKK